MRLLIFMLALATAAAQQTGRGGTQKEVRVNDAVSKIFESSHDPKQLLQVSLDLARSSQVEDHTYLARWLRSAEFLSRLDTAQEYASTGRRLRISMVLQALSMNSAPSAQGVIVHLAGSREFLGNDSRVDFLIQYSQSIRPATEDLVRFWDSHFQPDDGFANLTASTLVANGTEPALRLLERKLADSRFEHEDKLSWMQSDIYAHRNEVALLLWCERVIAGKTLGDDLKLALAEVLFDPKPQQWFRPATVIVPPPLEQSSAEAKTALQRIGKQVLQANWATPDLRQGVQRTLATIDSSAR